MECHVPIRIDARQYRECCIADRQEPVEVTSGAEGSTGRVVKSDGLAANLKCDVTALPRAAGVVQDGRRVPGHRFPDDLQRLRWPGLFLLADPAYLLDY